MALVQDCQWPLELMQLQGGRPHQTIAVPPVCGGDSLTAARVAVSDISEESASTLAVKQSPRAVLQCLGDEATPVHSAVGSLISTAFSATVIPTTSHSATVLLATSLSATNRLAMPPLATTRSATARFVTAPSISTGDRTTPTAPTRSGGTGSLVCPASPAAGQLATAPSATPGSSATAPSIGTASSAGQLAYRLQRLVPLDSLRRMQQSGELGLRIRVVSLLCDLS